MRYDGLIFDLDGTLWDSSFACAESWMKIARECGLKDCIITADNIRSVAGKSHKECIEILFRGLPENQIQVLDGRTRLEDNLMIRKVGAELFADVKSGLYELKEKYPLFIASNCQRGYIETFLDLFELHDVFTDFECWGNTGKSKTHNVQRLMQSNHLKNPLMVGDAEGDEKAAKDCGIDFAYFTYGFGKCSEPTYQFKTFNELVRAV